MDFQERLEHAIERGRRLGSARAEEEAQRALTEKELQRLHSQARLQLSEHIERLKARIQELEKTSYLPLLGYAKIEEVRSPLFSDHFMGGRVEFTTNRKVRWGVTESERPLVETSGEPLGRAPFSPKSSLHRPVVQLSKLTQSANPEPPKQVDEVRQVEYLHREVTEPLRRRAMRHYQAFSCSESRRERPISDPHLTRGLRGCSAGRAGDGCDCGTRSGADLLCERDLSPEITSGGSGR